MKASLQNPLNDKKVIEFGHKNNEIKRRSTSLASLPNKNDNRNNSIVQSNKNSQLKYSHQQNEGILPLLNIPQVYKKKEINLKIKNIIKRRNSKYGINPNHYSRQK